MPDAGLRMHLREFRRLYYIIVPNHQIALIEIAPSNVNSTPLLRLTKSAFDGIVKINGSEPFHIIFSLVI